MMGALVVACAALVAAADPARAPCAGKDAHVVVDSGEHALWLCAGAEELRRFGVRLGAGGVGKTREGDDKVPLGVYGLGRPRASKAYGIFIPIDYPTQAQRRRGYTGGGVGVHGPDRRVRWLGSLTNTFDTTAGCVGLATDQEMAAIAAWVRKSKAARIEIR
jgi:murein L,D-transpeptidase YafK